MVAVGVTVPVAVIDEDGEAPNDSVLVGVAVALRVADLVARGVLVELRERVAVMLDDAPNVLVPVGETLAALAVAESDAVGVGVDASDPGDADIVLLRLRGSGSELSEDDSDGLAVGLRVPLLVPVVAEAVALSGDLLRDGEWLSVLLPPAL